MQTFLQLVAQDLHQKIGNDLSRVAIVFPNKRASLFFNEHLAAQSDRPLWSPAYVSISELFRQLSPWKLGDPIRLVCELYKYFVKKPIVKKHLMISISGENFLSAISMMSIKILLMPTVYSLICKT